jgi:hypothetical protein
MPYRLGNNRCKPRLPAAFRARRVACPILSGQAAAAALRARCVFTHGFPVLSVHFSFGFARHVGQLTDKIGLRDFKVRPDFPTSPVPQSAARRDATP